MANGVPLDEVTFRKDSLSWKVIVGLLTAAFGLSQAWVVSISEKVEANTNTIAARTYVIEGAQDQRKEAQAFRYDVMERLGAISTQLARLEERLDSFTPQHTARNP